MIWHCEGHDDALVVYGDEAGSCPVCSYVAEKNQEIDHWRGEAQVLRHALENIPMEEYWEDMWDGRGAPGEWAGFMTMLENHVKAVIAEVEEAEVVK